LSITNRSPDSIEPIVTLTCKWLALASGRICSGWEFQLDGLVLRAQGCRTLTGGALDPQIPSNAQGLAIEPLARWNFLQVSRRPFVEVAGDFVLFDRPWPTYGTINDFFLRAGGGVSVQESFCNFDYPETQPWQLKDIPFAERIAWLEQEAREREERAKS
jgi:hypothetical protein